MSTASLWGVYPSSEVSYGSGFTGSSREGNRVLDSLKSSGCCNNLMFKGRLLKGPKNRMDSGYMKACLMWSLLEKSRLNNRSRVSVMSKVIAEPAGVIGLSSEQKVYDVVVKQAALVKRELKSSNDTQMKREIILPGPVSMLGEAYDRCREVCAEYAKTFYLGTLLMTPERRRAIWAIYGKTRPPTFVYYFCRSGQKLLLTWCTISFVMNSVILFSIRSKTLYHMRYHSLVILCKIT